MTTPLVLCVLDGWGLAPPSSANAIAAAATPTFDALQQQGQIAALEASGSAVGLPDGQMGNSEVGHMTIGAGQVILQDLPRISKALTRDFLKTAPAIQDLLRARKTLHVFTLLSAGGIHSHESHLWTLLDYLKACQDTTVWLHLITDGRDSAVTAGRESLRHLLSRVADSRHMRIATLGGRYFYMDRDKRYARLQQALEVIQGAGTEVDDLETYLGDNYENRLFDEFIPPVRCRGFAGIGRQDGALFTNFRADRMRQLTEALFLPDYTALGRGPELPLRNPGVSFTSYGAHLAPYLRALFPRPQVERPLGRVISRAGYRQLRLAETEKFAHVTYFFNGGIDHPFPGEERTMVPSPNVATYDLQPEMSASAVTDVAIESLFAGAHDVIIMNYANADMVGHTGDFEATVAACRHVDQCLGRLKATVDQVGATLMVTADHGNADVMLTENQEKVTTHSINPVPLIIHPGASATRIQDTGLQPKTLADIAACVGSVLGCQGEDSDMRD